VIDFRFFLISIVAVFLALGIGIVMGSGVLGGPILEGLERRADAVLERNDQLREQIAELERERAEGNDFASTVEPALTNGELAGEDVVLLQAEGTDEELIVSIERLVEEAGGDISTRIVLTNKFALADEADVESLSRVVGSEAAGPSELRAAVGATIGSRLGAWASERAADPASGFARGRALEMLSFLQDDGFVSVERIEEEPVIPPRALFVVAAGAESEPVYDTGELVLSLAGRAAERGTEALVTEPTNSTWGVVADLRADPELATEVSTVDHGETTSGRVSIALSLPEERGVGHWGTDDGAEAIVPAPAG
jgi:hypothetical protein